MRWWHSKQLMTFLSKLLCECKIQVHAKSESNKANAVSRRTFHRYFALRVCWAKNESIHVCFKDFVGFFWRYWQTRMKHRKTENFPKDSFLIALHMDFCLSWTKHQTERNPDKVEKMSWDRHLKVRSSNYDPSVPKEKHLIVLSWQQTGEELQLGGVPKAAQWGGGGPPGGGLAAGSAERSSVMMRMALPWVTPFRQPRRLKLKSLRGFLVRL